MQRQMITADQKLAVLGAARPGWRYNENGTGEPVKRTLDKGSAARRVVAEKTFPVDRYTGTEVGFHATKGWRKRRVSL